MHSLTNKIKLPSIEDIEKLHGTFKPEIEQDEEEVIDTAAMILEAEAKCERIIADANKKAQEIEENAKAEAEKLKRSQSKEGYIEGKDKAEKEMAAVLKEHNAEFARQIDAMANYREQMFEVVKSHAIDCLKILYRKIIFKEYDEDNEVINTMVDHYYSMIKDRTNLVLRVSRADYDKLNLTQLENRGIQIKVDETFTSGDLTISCDAEGISFGLEEQLNKIDSSIGV